MSLATAERRAHDQREAKKRAKQIEERAKRAAVPQSRMDTFVQQWLDRANPKKAGVGEEDSDSALSNHHQKPLPRSRRGVGKGTGLPSRARAKPKLHPHPKTRPHTAPRHQIRYDEDDEQGVRARLADAWEHLPVNADERIELSGKEKRERARGYGRWVEDMRLRTKAGNIIVDPEKLEEHIGGASPTALDQSLEMPAELSYSMSFSPAKAPPSSPSLFGGSPTQPHGASLRMEDILTKSYQGDARAFSHLVGKTNNQIFKSARWPPLDFSFRNVVKLQDLLKGTIKPREGKSSLVWVEPLRRRRNTEELMGRSKRARPGTAGPRLGQVGDGNRSPSKAQEEAWRTVQLRTVPANLVPQMRQKMKGERPHTGEAGQTEEEQDSDSDSEPKEGAEMEGLELREGYHAAHIKLNNNNIEDFSYLPTLACEMIISFDCIRFLDLSFNSIAYLPDQWGTLQIERLHLHGNRLESLSEIEKLAPLCGTLRRVTLHGNPIIDQPQYRPLVLHTLPHLISLDFVTLNKGDREMIKSQAELCFPTLPFTISTDSPGPPQRPKSANCSGSRQMEQPVKIVEPEPQGGKPGRRTKPNKYADLDTRTGMPLEKPVYRSVYFVR